MVVNLGEKAKLYLTPGQYASKDFKLSGSKIYRSTPGMKTNLCLGPKSFSIEVEIPPRSVYIMKEDARYKYQHGIRKQSLKNIGNQEELSWNTNRLRRSLVFRTSKCYNDFWLEDQFRENSENIDIYERLTIAKNYYLALENGKKANKKEIELERTIANLKLLQIIQK